MVVRPPPRVPQARRRQRARSFASRVREGEGGARAEARRRDGQCAVRVAAREEEFVRGHHHLQQLLRVGHRQVGPQRQRGQAADASLDGERRRRSREAAQVGHRGDPQVLPHRGARLSPALCRGVVDGDSLGRISARGLPQEARSDQPGEVRRVRERRATADARREGIRGDPLSLPRRLAHRRGDASAHAAGRRSLRRPRSEEVLLKKALVPTAFAACCVPLLWLALQAATSGLGANPVEELLNDLGYTAFVLLALTLACTPLQIVFGWNWPIRIRKLLGDFCFFYACVHMLTYVVIDQGLDLKAVATDVLKHKFIFLGMATWLLLLPLAVTSTPGMQPTLGLRRRQPLPPLLLLVCWLRQLYRP